MLDTDDEKPVKVDMDKELCSPEGKDNPFQSVWNIHMYSLGSGK